MLKGRTRLDSVAPPLDETNLLCQQVWVSLLLQLQTMLEHWRTTVLMWRSTAVPWHPGAQHGLVRSMAPDAVVPDDMLAPELLTRRGTGQCIRRRSLLCLAERSMPTPGGHMTALLATLRPSALGLNVMVGRPARGTCGSRGHARRGGNCNALWRGHRSRRDHNHRPHIRATVSAIP